MGHRTFLTNSLRLVSETNFGKNLSPLSISFEFRGRNRHITFIVTASAISISQILKKNFDKNYIYYQGLKPKKSYRRSKYIELRSKIIETRR